MISSVEFSFPDSIRFEDHSQDLLTCKFSALCLKDEFWHSFDKR